METVYDKYDIHYRQVIEKKAKPVEQDGKTWLDISESRDYDAIRYLRLRGLIVTHPSHVLIQFK